MTRIFTSHYSYTGEDRLDITVKTGNKAFSPTWDMVWGVKNGSMLESEFIEQYAQILKTSLIVKKEEWDEIFVQDRVTLVCFCPVGQFCHRKVLARYLEYHFGDKCRYEGEI